MKASHKKYSSKFSKLSTITEEKTQHEQQNESLQEQLESQNAISAKREQSQQTLNKISAALAECFKSNHRMTILQKVNKLTRNYGRIVQKMETLSTEKQDIVAQYERYKIDAEQTQIQLTKQIKIEHEHMQQKNEDKLRQKEEMWNKERDELQNKMKDVNDECNGLVIKLSELTKDIERLTEEKEAATAKLTETKTSANDRYIALEAQYNKLNATNENEIKISQKEYERLTKDKEAAIAKVAQFSHHFVQKNEEMRTKLSTLSIFTNELTTLSDECEQLRQKETLWDHERDELQNKMNHIHDKYDQLRQKTKIWNKERDELQNKNDECKGWMIKFTEDIERLTKEKEEATTKVARLWHKNKELRTKCEQLRQKEEIWNKECDELQNKNDECKGLVIKLKEYETKQGQFAQDIERLTKEKEAATATVAQLSHNYVRRNEELRTKCSTITDECELLRHKKVSWNKERDELQNKMKDVEDESKRLVIKLKEYETKHDQLTQTKTSANDRYNALEAQYNKIRENMDAVNELNAKNVDEIKRLQQELNEAKQSENSKQTKLKQMTYKENYEFIKEIIQEMLQQKHKQVNYYNSAVKYAYDGHDDQSQEENEYGQVPLNATIADEERNNETCNNLLLILALLFVFVASVLMENTAIEMSAGCTGISHSAQ